MSNWQVLPLGDLVDIHDSRRIPLSQAERSKRPGPFPYYGAQGVIDHIDDFIFDGRYILVPEDGENLRSRKLPIAYFAEGKFWVNNHAHIVSASPGTAVDRFIQSAIEASDIGAFVTGAAQPKLSQANLRRIELRVPDLATQETIGEILDSLDDLIENNRRRIEILEEMAQAIYREWFVHFRFPGHEDATFVDSPLGPIPEGWSVRKASEAVAINPRTKSLKEVADPFFAMSDISERSLVCFPSEIKDGTSGSKFLNGDTLFARITPCLENGKIGYVAVLDEGQVGRGSTEFIVLRGSIVGSAFTYFLARDPDFRGHAIASMSGASGRQRVRNECFDSYELAVPPGAIAERFERCASPMMREAFSLAHQNQSLITIRDLLLPKLVSGEIDVSALDLDALVGRVS